MSRLIDADKLKENEQISISDKYAKILCFMRFTQRSASPVL